MSSRKFKTRIELPSSLIIRRIDGVFPYTAPVDLGGATDFLRTRAPVGDSVRQPSCLIVQNLVQGGVRVGSLDRKSTRLNSSHQIISYAVFCLKKKKKTLLCFSKIFN